MPDREAEILGGEDWHLDALDDRGRFDPSDLDTVSAGLADDITSWWNRTLA